MQSQKCRFLQFGLRSLFALVTIIAWCTWQWTISERRKAVAAELKQFGYLTNHDTTIPKNELDRVCKKMWFGNMAMAPIRRSLLGSVVGYDNWEGLTVVVRSSLVVDERRIIDALTRLPGLTTVVIYDANPATERAENIIEFKRQLREKRSEVKIEHVHLRNMVG